MSIVKDTLILGRLQAVYNATVKNPAKDADLEKFVAAADPTLQVLLLIDQADVNQLFEKFFKATGLDAAGARERFIAVLANSTQGVGPFLAANLQSAIKLQEVYKAPLPANLERVTVYRSPAAAGGHELAGTITVLSGLGAKGKGADVFEVPAHVAIIPQHRTLDSKRGGGSPGGIAAYGVHKVARATAKLPPEIRDQALASMVSFQDTLAAAKNPLSPGCGTLVSTGVDDPSVLAGAFYHCPLVPPDELRLSAQMTDEARLASQPARMRFGQDMLAAALESLKTQAVALYGEPNIASPLVIASPMLNTGTAALFTEEEAGWIYGQVARTFLDNNPGFGVVFAPYGEYRATELVANRDSFIVGLQSIDAPPPSVTKEDVKSPAQLLALAAQAARANAASGPTVNLADDAVLTAEIAKVKEQMLAALTSSEAGDRYVGGAAVNKAAGYALSEAFWQAHRMAELPAKAQQYTGGGKATDRDGLATPTTASLRALLDSEALMFEMRETLKNALGGNDDTITAPQTRLSEVIALAMARTLQQSRHDYVNESQARLTNEVAGADAKVKGLQSIFGPKYRTLVEQMQEAQTRLAAALEQGKSLEASVKEYKAEIKRLSTDTSLVGDELKRTKADLTKKINELADAQRQLATAQAAARSSASTYSRATSSYSG